MNTSVPSLKFSLTARARPARLLNDAGLATTAREPDNRCARWFLVEVLPYEPVMATTVGWTRRRRWDAVWTNLSARRRSNGEVSAQAMSTIAGTAIRAAAPISAGAPT